MATNWKTIALEDVQAFMSGSVISASSVLNEADSAGNQRFDKLRQIVVDRMRAAILTGGRTPLALAENTVPPEAVTACCYLIIKSLVAATPRAAEFVDNKILGKAFEDAEEFLKNVASIGESLSLTSPSDPDPDTLPNYDWGDSTGRDGDGTQTVFSMNTTT